jgi:hypothetical protein
MCVLSAGVQSKNIKVEGFSTDVPKPRDRCVVFSPSSTKVCVYNIGKAVVNDVVTWQPVLNKLSTRDVMVVNFGVHYNDKNRELLQLHCKMMAEEYQQRRSTLPHFLWRETLAQHFKTPSGLFGGDNCVGDACGCGSWNSRNPKLYAKANWRNTVCGPAFEAIGVHVIPAFNLSVAGGDLHRGGRDCTHFCNPGFLEALVPVMYHSIGTVI